ncbi:MAG TPA: S8 family serine peptidase [Kamptonema sp.]|nr:S8 family serine peptidase [Kamptonema sp.]
MSSQNEPVLPPKIYTEAVVRSITGASLLRYSHPVTSENVTQFYAEPEQVELAIKRLKAAGFEILEVGFATISIAGQPELYERSFQTTLEAVERPTITEMGEIGTTILINSVDNTPFGEIDTSKTIWDDVLDGIAINEPVYYSRPTIPTSEPPEKTAKYLNVPDDVAQGLNANLVHQNGITGKGVRVAMIDSGWYPHPFFREHNYKVNVVLAPGATDPEEDISGHGTGESANIFAIAPETELIMIKFGIVVEGKIANVDSIAAFKRAIEQRPDIISCSWGSDQRNRQLSPQDKLLAAAVARAVYEGIVVIFSAGNGQWGFPAQHPEAIAVGGVYKHLKGSLKGLLEASNYASSFISPVYPGRRVPDVCGLVGQLPNGAYIRLPVPPGSLVDRARSAAGDGTLPSDGWAVFSGTSAAAPQIAGICALLKQLDPSLSPARVKQILQQTAHDVTEGFSNPSTGGNRASPGVDLATGYGLADADASVEVIKALSNKKSCDDCAFSVQNFSKLNSTTIRRKPMFSEFPKLQKKLDELRWEFEKKLQEVIKNNEELEDVELRISEANFIPRSPITKVAYSLRERLDKCFYTKEQLNQLRNEQLVQAKKVKIDKSKITEEHISSAQALMKIGRYQETAILVLTEALLITETDIATTEHKEKEAKKLRKMASEALSDCGTEIAMFDTNSRNEATFFAKEGEQCCCVDNQGHCIKYGISNGKKCVC